MGFRGFHIHADGVLDGGQHDVPGVRIGGAVDGVVQAQGSFFVFRVLKDKLEQPVPVFTVDHGAPSPSVDIIADSGGNGKRRLECTKNSAGPVLALFPLSGRNII